MAIEYTFGTTADLSAQQLVELLTDTIGDADVVSFSSENDRRFALVYENQMSVYDAPPTYTPDSPGQTYWNRTLGSRPKIRMIFRWVNGADAQKADDAMLSFVLGFLRLYEDDAVFTYYDTLLLRYKGKIQVGSDNRDWAKRFEQLDQPYSLVSKPKPDSDNAGN